MTPPDNLDWLDDCLREVGSYQKKAQNEIDVSNPETKGRIDLVTQVDRKSEQMLVQNIKSEYPEDSIHTEEELSQSGKSNREWIIDPLDGTTNYVNGHPFYGISVALRQDHRITVGKAYFPKFQDLYSARRNSGAWKNGNSLQVSTIQENINSLLATGFADLRKEKERDRYNLKPFETIIQQVQGVRRGGSAVHDLCLTAEGVFEAFWEYNLHPWDVAAGSLLIQEAGGKVTDMFNSDGWLQGKNIVASNGHLHDQMINWLEPYQPTQKGSL